MATGNTPDTLLGAITYFADVDVATAFVAGLRWPDGVRCPHCDSVDMPYVKSRRIWQCKNCRKQFTVKVGTIFEDSPIPLVEVAARDVDARQLQERREQLRNRPRPRRHPEDRVVHAAPSAARDSGEVVRQDERRRRSRRNLHRRQGSQHARRRSGSASVSLRAVRWRQGRRHGSAGTARQGRTSARFASSVDRRTASGVILQAASSRQHVERGANVYTDALPSYDRHCRRDYTHNVIDHAEAYVDGQSTPTGWRTSGAS